jgi:imidazolonepropionase-like amidohydrolase
MGQEMKGDHYISAGWLIDGSGEKIQKNRLIRIKGGRISSIEAPSSIKNDHKEVVDLSAYTVLPPLIDCHVHLFMSGSSDASVRERQLVAGYAEMRPVMERHLRQQFAHGVLALRDGGDRQGHALRFVREAPIPLCRALSIHVAGQAWHAPKRYGRLIGHAPAQGQTLAEAVAADPERLQQIHHIKLANSGINSLKQFGRQTPPQFAPEEIKKVVHLAERHHLKVMVHANGAVPVRGALDAGCHSIEHGFFMGRENLKIMAARQIVWVPTAFTMQAYARTLAKDTTEADVAQRNFDHQVEQLAFARACGVPIAVGTDAGSLGVHHGGAYGEELKVLLTAGFTIEAAIHSAVSVGGRLLGQANAVPFEKGAAATFLAVPGDPTRLPDRLSERLLFIDGMPIADASF